MSRRTYLETIFAEMAQKKNEIYRDVWSGVDDTASDKFRWSVVR